VEKAGVKCAAIHGNKSQNRRQEALGNFKCEQIRVLVATDIAARGIDVDDVSHVFNYDLPNEHETFVHRIGRTARAGKDGVAISFCSPDEESDLRGIEKLTRVKIPEGDQSIYDKLPPPQKETAESMMRNSRGRMSREEAQARAAESRNNRGARGRKDNRNENRENARSANAGNTQNVNAQNSHAMSTARPFGRSQNVNFPAGNTPQPQNGGRHHRRNRPGSRARRRMREAQGLQ
ncbi:MAG: DEAD/DEAH box helicase, partial [Fibrobacter sp.]|nr:DEAD/DEAH box helicase [Fibrobacter sp.]